MDIRKLIKVNIVNIAILGAVILFKFVTGLLFNDHGDAEESSMVMLSNIMTLILLVGWAGYTVYSNLAIIREERDLEKKRIAGLRHRISKAGNLKFFTQERSHLVNMWDSIQSREKYFLSEDRDERVRDLYVLTRNQMMRNVTDACEYLESFDYISGKDSGYLKGMCQDSEVLLNKFNTVVELSVSVDDDVLAYDTRELDDMLESLEEMKKTGRNKLGV